MLSSTTSFDWSQNQMNGTTENPARSMPSSFDLRTTTDGDDVRRKPPGSATAADQQAAAAAAPLKCPRCDSSNTKFCYYNNYSLSQPRHFCKACKRYWTRGGTLRNVPVGGGCRKTKQRVRQPCIKPPITGQRKGHDNGGSDQAARSKGLIVEQPNLVLNGLLYGKNSANIDIFNTFGADSRAGYNQTQNLGLGFSPGDDYMGNNDQSNNSSYLFAYSTLFGSSGLSPPFPTGIYSAPPLMRSTLGSGFEYEKFVNETSSVSKGQMGNFQSVLPLEDMNIGGNDQGSERGSAKKGEEQELGLMKINQMGSLSPSSFDEDPSIHNWNHGPSSNMNIWPDASNMSSSVMSLL